MKVSNDCWLYARNIDYGGYATITYTVKGKRYHQKLHRVMYEDVNGKIPENHVIDHLCKIRSCINPAHLEAITQLENVRRGKRIATECIKGHKYDEANTYYVFDGKYYNKRCKECKRRWR